MGGARNRCVGFDQRDDIPATLSKSSPRLVVLFDNIYRNSGGQGVGRIVKIGDKIGESLLPRDVGFQTDIDIEIAPRGRRW